MGKLRLAATAAALTVAAFAAPAFAQVSSAADCEYEGGEVFNVCLLYTSDAADE